MLTPAPWPAAAKSSPHTTNAKLTRDAKLEAIRNEYDRMRKGDTTWPTEQDAIERIGSLEKLDGPDGERLSDKQIKRYLRTRRSRLT